MGKVEEILAKILGIGPEEITDETSPENMDAWDSFNGLMLASELENTFKVEFTMDEITNVKNVGDIKKNLKKHNIQV